MSRIKMINPVDKLCGIRMFLSYILRIGLESDQPGYSVKALMPISQIGQSNPIAGSVRLVISKYAIPTIEVFL
jgi:hypothetical protein